MKMLKTFVLSFMLLGCAGTASAENFKIGVINLHEVVAKSPEAVLIRENLQKEFKYREEEIIKIDKLLRENGDKLQRDGAVMSEAERGKLEREAATNQRELQRLQTAYREDASVRQQEEMQQFIEKVRLVMNEFAEEQKYDLLLQSDMVSFAAEKMIVTNQVIEKLKNKG